MKKLMLLLTSLLFCSIVHAGNMFYERPVFMDKRMPDTVECKPGTNGTIYCLSNNVRLPTNSNAVVHSDEDPAPVSRSFPNFVYVSCNRSCGVEFLDYAAGMVNGVLTAYTYTGYYLDDSTGTLLAHKRGTGPKARIYPEWLITTETANALPTYDVWCDPHSDVCSYKNYNISREGLKKHIPLAKNMDDCYMEFCMNMVGDVIGLNPEYHLYK